MISVRRVSSVISCTACEFSDICTACEFSDICTACVQ